MVIMIFIGWKSIWWKSWWSKDENYECVVIGFGIDVGNFVVCLFYWFFFYG